MTIVGWHASHGQLAPSRLLAAAAPLKIGDSTFGFLVAAKPRAELRDRWVPLVAGITGMVAVANVQYSWTLFVLPLHDRHGWAEPRIQYALYLFFVPAQTWLVPLEGYLAERFGPRRLLIGGAALAGLATARLAAG